jgi:hypothetical protein
MEFLRVWNISPMEDFDVAYATLADSKDIRQEDCAQVGVETLW